MKTAKTNTKPSKKDLEASQIKAQMVAATLDKEIVDAGKGKQHIAVQAGKNYEIIFKNDNIIEKDFSVVTKKTGNDLEVFIEEGVIIFDNYFEICAIDLSCLVSLPAEGNGVFYITLESFLGYENNEFTYFYTSETPAYESNTTIISSNTLSLISTGLFAISVNSGGTNRDGSGSGSGSDSNDVAKGVFSAGKYTGGEVKNAVYVYDKNGNLIANADLQENGTYLVNKDALGANYKTYNDTIYLRLKASDDIKFLNEATNVTETLKEDLYAVATLNSGLNSININVQTTIMAQIAVGHAISVANDKLTAGKTLDISAEKITKAGLLVQRALGLESSVLTTNVDTVNSVNVQEGNARAGQVAAALSGASTSSGDFQAIIDQVSASIDAVGGLTKIVADKLSGGIIVVADKMKTDAQAKVDAAKIAMDAAQKIVTDAQNATSAQIQARDDTKAAYDKAVADKNKINEYVDELKSVNFDDLIVPITESGFKLSADTGASDSDLITNEKDQAVSMTLNDQLKENQNLWFSVDKSTWIKIDSTDISNMAINVKNIELIEGTHLIQLVISTATDSNHVTDSDKQVGMIAMKYYTLDKTAPTVAADALTLTSTDNTGAIKSENNTLAETDKLILTIDLGESVNNLTSLPTGTNNTIIEVGANKVAASWSVTGNNLMLTYTVQANQAGMPTINGVELKKALAAADIKDIAGNDIVLSDFNNIIRPGEIDSVAPMIKSFTSTTTDGYYKADEEINITATASENLKAGSKITVTLELGNTDEQVVLTAIENGTKLTGTFRIGTNSVYSSADLAVASFTLGDKNNANIPADAVGNIMTSHLMTSIDSNISDTSDIVIDTTAPVFNDGVGNAAVVATSQNDNFATTVIYTATTTDDNTVTYELDGDDKGKFMIEANGDVKYNAKQPHANDNTTHSVIVVATDSAGNISKKTVIVTLKNFSTSILWVGATTDDYINVSEKSAVTLEGDISGGVTSELAIKKIEIFSNGTQVGDDITSGWQLNGRHWVLDSTTSARFSSLSDGSYTAKVTIQNGVESPIFSTSKVVTYSTTVPTQTINSIDIVDTGSSDSDFITKTTGTGQTITATLNIALNANDKLYYRLDGAANIKGDLTGWKDATSSVSNTSISIANANLLTGGNRNIAFKIVEDSGNESLATKQDYTLDTTAPTAPIIDTIATNNTINLVEKNAGVTITGTTDVDTLVALRLGSFTRTAIIGNSGTTWSYTLTDDDFGAIGQGAGRNIIVEATDVAGNVASSFKSISIYTVAPSAPIINTIATDDTINLVEQDAGVTITGTTDANTSVVLSIGNITRTATIGSSGTTWSYTLINVDFSDIGQGTGKNITVSATNIAGNVATSSKSISLDTVLPTATVSNNFAPDADLVMSFNEQITLGSGNIIIYHKSDNSIAEIINVNTDANAIGKGLVVLGANGRELNINPVNDLTTGIEYYVKIDKGAFKDIAGNDYMGISAKTGVGSWEFIVASLSTTVVWSDGTNDISSNGINKNELENSLQITGTLINVNGIAKNVSIDKIIFKAQTGDANNKIYTGTMPALNSENNSTWTLTHDQVTSLNLQNGETYTIEVQLKSQDSDGNDVNGINQNGVGVLIDTVAPSQPIMAIKSGDDNYVNNLENGVNMEISATGMAEGDTIQLIRGNTNINMHTVTTAEASQGKVTLLIAKADLEEGNNAITMTIADKAGNLTSNDVPINIIKDTALLTIESSTIRPVFGEEDNIIINFNKNITKGTGVIKIWKTDSDSLIESIDINTTDSNVINISTNQLSLDPSAKLSEGNYYITMESGVVVDNAGNKVAAVTKNSNTWTFTTRGLSTTIMWKGAEDSDNYIGIADQAAADYGLTGTLSGTNPSVENIGFFEKVASGSLIYKFGVVKADIIIDSSNSKLWSVSKTKMDTLAFEDGKTYVAQASLKDTSSSGITTSSKEVTFDLVLNKPTVVLEHDTGMNGDDTDAVTNNWRTTTSVAEINSIRVYMLKKNNVEVSSVTNYSSYAAYMNSADDAIYKLTIKDTDKAQNEATSDELTFTLDRTAPNAPNIEHFLASDTHITIAEAATGVIKVTGEAGFKLDIEFSNANSYVVNKKIDSATGSRQTVSLSSADLNILGQGLINVKVTVTDTSGNSTTNIEDNFFTVDTIAPTLATNPTITTTDGGNTKDDTVILTLTFDENVGGLISGNADDIFKVGAMAVSASWSGAQDTATRTLTYIVSTENGRVSIDADALKTALVAGIEKDAAGNSFAYAGAITISGTLPMVDTLAPSLITTDAIVANDVDDSSNYTADDTITFKFSESIQNVNLSDFSATGKTLNLGAGATTTVSGNDIVLKLGDAGLNLTTGDVLQLNKSAVLDAVNNTLADTGTIDFTLPGFMPATPLAESKINGVINIDVQTDIVLTFKGNVTAGDGHIELIDNNVGDPLNADGDWKRNADGIIVDENGNALDVNDITVEWETLGAPDVEDVDSAGNSVKGYGWIGDVYKNDIIFDANSVGTGAADGKNVAVTYTYDATTDSTLVVINPSRDLDFATDYKLVFGVGAFKYSGSSTISTRSEMSFSTVTPAANDTGQASKIMKNTDGTLEDSYIWFSAHQKFREGLPLEVDFGSIKGAWAVGLGNDSHPAYSSTRNNHGYLLLQNFLNDDLMYRDNSNGSKTLAGARIESTGDTENQNWVPGTDPEGSRISLSALRVELEGYFNIVADTVLENCLDEGRFIGKLTDIYKDGDFSTPAALHAPENMVIG